MSVIVTSLVWLLILAIVALSWHISIRKLSKSCTSDDAQKTITSSSSLSLWLSILSILAFVALAGLLMYRAREGAQEMQVTP